MCKVLEIVNVSQALNGDLGLDDDEKDDIRITDAIGRKQATLCVNEPGLYHLISKSRTPEAKAFGSWIRHEVLPAIRKTGSYSLPQPEYQNDYVGISDTIGRGRIIKFISEVAMVAPVSTGYKESLYPVDTGYTLCSWIQGHDIRVVIHDGEPWFVISEIS